MFILLKALVTLQMIEELLCDRLTIKKRDAT